MSSTGQGRIARLGIGAVVGTSALLALVALVALNWLAARPGVRVRFDLTRGEQNSLSTAAQGVVNALQEPVTIDVFFRPEEGPLVRVADQVQQRTRRLLRTFAETSAGRIELRFNDTRDAQAIQERTFELRLRGFENCLVVSVGDRRQVVRLVGDLATFDPGKPPPDPQPARILSFDAERAIVKAILEVTTGDRLELYFTAGRGEADPFGEGPDGLEELRKLLADEGLRVNRWNSAEDGPIPEDCACLTIVAPQDGFDDETIDAIEAYVKGGGRLVIAPHPFDPALEQSRIPVLVERFGMEVLPGLVCQPYRDQATGAIGGGVPDTQGFPILPANLTNHPMLAPILREQRFFLVLSTHPVRLVSQPPGGSASVLFRSSANGSWLEAYRADEQPPWNYLPDPDEDQGRRFDLGVAAVFPVSDADLPAALEQRPEGRVVVLGSAPALQNSLFAYNSDFLRNLYNWVLDREYRILISAKDPAIVRFSPSDAEKVVTVNRVAWGWLPLGCVVLGLLTAFLRTRGGPRGRR